MSIQLYTGDCLALLPTLAENSVDSIVTDPPYGLGFMGKDWDHGVPGVQFWAAALRVAKPGAHLLAFGGTRTFHRLACAIEDAGWEIRDCIMWVYGSGFPKSLDVSKAIDKSAGIERQIAGSKLGLPGYSPTMGKGANCYGGGFGGNGDGLKEAMITLPATDSAQKWQGWGTALKPAWEPIIVARKPLEGTVEQNVRKWGTGAMNVDGCRIGENGGRNNGRQAGTNGIYGHIGATVPIDYGKGRWPSNVIHDGSEDVLAEFSTAGDRSCGGGHRDGEVFKDSPTRFTRGLKARFANIRINDSGTAARFFYCAKASRCERERGCESLKKNLAGTMDGGEIVSEGRTASRTGRILVKNHHPTVKPVALMRYLCRLVTPPGGTVLDPFMGSGSTGIAAVLEGFDFCGIEKEAEYVEIARRRIAATTGPLFTSARTERGENL